MIRKFLVPRNAIRKKGNSQAIRANQQIDSRESGHLSFCPIFDLLVGTNVFGVPVLEDVFRFLSLDQASERNF